MARRRRRKPNPAQDVALLVVVVAVIGGLGLRSLVSDSTIQLMIFGLVLVGVGGLAAVIWYNWWQNRQRADRARAVTGDLIDHMPGVEFERYIGEILTWRGFKITYTPSSGDFGVDIVAVKNGDRYAVQIKRYKGKLGLAAIQQAMAGKPVYKCNKAMVVTNSYFTPAARKLAEHNECELIDRDVLADWILNFQKRIK